MKKSCSIILLTLIAKSGVANGNLTPLPPPNNYLTTPIWSSDKQIKKPNLAFDRESKTLTLDSQTLSNDPALLRQAMIAVIRQRYLAGIEKILPLYRQSPIANLELIAYAQGLLFLGQNKASESAAEFAKILQKYPQAQTARFYYAVATFENNHFYQAKQLFEQLLQQDPPPSIQQEINQFLAAIDGQQAWRFRANLNWSYDRNINNAPDERYSGGFTFPEKVSDTGIFYQFGLEKKLVANKGVYFQPAFELFGKYYLKEKAYNDTKANLSFGIGLENQTQDFLLQPFALKRWYGNKLYSNTSGLRLGWLQQWQPQFSTYAGLGYETERYLTSSFLNGHKQSFSLRENYRLTPNQTISFGQDFSRKYGTRDLDDSYREWGLIVNWYQQWHNGLALRLGLNYLKTNYQGATLLTGNQKRRDREWGVTTTFHHQKVAIYGIRPKLTLRYLRHNSNSALHRFSKKELFLTFERTF